MRKHQDREKQRTEGATFVFARFTADPKTFHLGYVRAKTYRGLCRMIIVDYESRADLKTDTIVPSMATCCPMCASRLSKFRRKNPLLYIPTFRVPKGTQQKVEYGDDEYFGRGDLRSNPPGSLPLR